MHKTFSLRALPFRSSIRSAGRTAAAEREPITTLNADALLHRLPIIVGVTGHRDLDLRPEYDAILRARVDAIFTRLQRDFPTTPLLLLTPLAEGADRLVAEVAHARGIAYRVPLPLPLSRYREDFTTAQSLAAFDRLLAGANTPPYVIGDHTFDDAGVDDDHLYALVGVHIARSCHVLIALWNGFPSDATGGTAQVVRFRVLGVPARYLPSYSVIDAPEVGPVHHIAAAQTSDGRTTHPVGTHTLRTRRDGVTSADEFGAIDERPGNARDPFEPLFRRIEEFNRDCLREPAPFAIDSPSATKRLMATAEQLATVYQRKTRASMTRLFVATATAALMFELYANAFPHLHLLVVPYVLAVAVALATFVRADRGRWQDRAQDYRALELGLNVQHVWDAVGVGESVADFYIGRLRTELDWIPKAIGAARIVDMRLPFDETRGLAAVRTFLNEQHAYFAGANGRPGAASRERARNLRFQTLRSWAFRSSFIFSTLLVAFAIAASIWPALYGGPERADLLRSLLIFGIGTTAVAAALLSDYPKRRGFSEHARRYELMAGLYHRALAALDDGPKSERLATARRLIADVGHEALAENGDWVLLHRALPIELLQLGG